MGRVERGKINGIEPFSQVRLFFKKWGELVNPFGAIFLIVGRVGEKVGRFGVGHFASVLLPSLARIKLQLFKIF